MHHGARCAAVRTRCRNQNGGAAAGFLLFAGDIPTCPLGGRPVKLRSYRLARAIAMGWGSGSARWCWLVAVAGCGGDARPVASGAAPEPAAPEQNGSSTAPGVVTPTARGDRACTSDDDCVTTTWTGCCPSCPCAEPYTVGRHALDAWQSACAAVDCAPRPTECPPCPTRVSLPRSTCRDAQCVLEGSLPEEPPDDERIPTAP